MTLFMEKVFENARRLNLPKMHIGVLWADIVDFCEKFEKAGESEENINKKLSKAIIATQNATFGKNLDLHKTVCLPPICSSLAAMI